MSGICKVMNIVGARPNFMKIAPLMQVMQAEPSICPILVHTGQHYDHEMSELFFTHLGIPAPDIDLEVGSGSHAQQTAQIMQRFEPVLLKHKPDLVLVVGDVNSTIACALTASKLHIKVAHVEAGLRSFDRRMPEEINRLLTDAISDYLFITEESAIDNLSREGIPARKIHFVGNVMIDTLLKNTKKAESSDIIGRLGFMNQDYALLTLHRPANVDNRETLERIFSALRRIGVRIPIIFPVHPRTKKQIESFGLTCYLSRPPYDLTGSGGIYTTPPLGYLDFLKLMSNAEFVLTDSGGMQEEATVLGAPCITLRENTERPVTVSSGTNILVGTDEELIVAEGLKVLDGKGKQGSIPKLWDGLAAQRIVDIIVSLYVKTNELG